VKKHSLNFCPTLQKAFTLIELLVVIAILGIISLAVLLSMDPTKKINLSKDARVKSDLSQMVNALQAYHANPDNNNGYPSTPDGLDMLIRSGELKSLPQQQDGATPCPATPDGVTAGTTYCYTVSEEAENKIAAVWGTLFSKGLLAWCWDSTTNKFTEKKIGEGLPTEENPSCQIATPASTSTSPVLNTCNVQNRSIQIFYIPIGTLPSTWRENTITRNLPSDATEINLRITQVYVDDNSAKVSINNQLVVNLYSEEDDMSAHSVVTNIDVSEIIKAGPNTFYGRFYDRHGNSAALFIALNGSYKTTQECSL
jgi:prepilin-type N-terminal cleavage/methylation domain-containing protein